MKSRLTYFLICCILRLNGWKRCRNCEGCPAWVKVVGKGLHCAECGGSIEVNRGGMWVHCIPGSNHSAKPSYSKTELKGDYAYALSQIKR